MFSRLAQMMKKARENEKGFTLIEMIVVILIIGIIAGLAISKLSGTVGTAKSKTDDLAVRQVQSAFERYWSEDTSPSNPTTATELANKLVPKYLDTMPTQSDTTKEFVYNGTSKKIVLQSK